MPQPVILSTWSFGVKANAAGWPLLTGGGDALDAVEQACIAVERDPAVDSVGYGGIPDRDGRVSLDGCVMLSPAQCGSVCFVQRYMHPASIARKVMERTPHVMLAGEGAEAFAAAQGFTAVDLLTPEAAARHREMAAALAADPASAFQRVITPANREEMYQEPSHDTVGVLALDAHGKLAGACSTSGLAMKMHGRVGDSPIIGHGLYVHPKFGAAVATGNGELVMGTCGSFLAVELMRQGKSPAEALAQCMDRLIESYQLLPHHQIGMIAITPAGDWAHLALRPGYRTAASHADHAGLIEAPAILPEPRERI